LLQTCYRFLPTHRTAASKASEIRSFDAIYAG